MAQTAHESKIEKMVYKYIKDIYAKLARLEEQQTELEKKINDRTICTCDSTESKPSES